MAEIQTIPHIVAAQNCCSIKFLWGLYSPVEEIEKLLLSPNAKYNVNSSIPVVFADNHSNKNYTPEQTALYGVPKSGGHYRAQELRDRGYRVDEIYLGDGAHGGEMSLFIWWPKDRSEGKKPSRIWSREDAKRKEQEPKKPNSSPEPGPNARKRVAGRIRRLRRLVPRSKL